MTTDMIAPYILRMYVADLLVNNGKLKLSDYVISGVQMSPVISLEDDPKLAPLGKPYLIYGYSEFESDELAVEHAGIISFLIYDQSMTTINNIIRVIKLAFEDSMFSTLSVNRYSTSKIPQASSFDSIRFTHICVSGIDSAEPAETEGGRISGVINLEYRYIEEATVNIFGENAAWTTPSNSQ